MKRFSEWRIFDDVLNDKAISNYGVYLISYNKNLKGKEVNEKDVEYVGMSVQEIGIKGRLNQFISRISGKSGKHAGASSFIKQYGKVSKKNFVVSFWDSGYKRSIPTKESLILDLKKRGEVSKKEYTVLIECFKASKYKKLLNKEVKKNEK